MIIAVDFDGTIVENQYPKIGKEIPFATETLRMLAQEGHQLILWTVREGKLLEEAVDWCLLHRLSFYAVNKNYPEEVVINQDCFCKKINADLFIDNNNIGGLPDWGTIYNLINQNKNQKKTSSFIYVYNVEKYKKKSWWKCFFNK